MKLLLLTLFVGTASASSLRGWFPRLLGLSPHKTKTTNTFQYTRTPNWGTCGPCWKHLHLVGYDGTTHIPLLKTPLNLDDPDDPKTVQFPIDTTLFIDDFDRSNYDSIQAIETKGKQEGTTTCNITNVNQTCYSHEAAYAAGKVVSGSSNDTWAKKDCVATTNSNHTQTFDGNFYCINGTIDGNTGDGCKCNCNDGWGGTHCTVTGCTFDYYPDGELDITDLNMFAQGVYWPCMGKNVGKQLWDPVADKFYNASCDDNRKDSLMIVI